jgi:hypothetical protein
MQGLFGDDWGIVQTLCFNHRYQVSVETLHDAEVNKYRIVRLDEDPNTLWRDVRVLIGEFDTPQELVAIARLIIATGNY